MGGGQTPFMLLRIRCLISLLVCAAWLATTITQHALCAHVLVEHESAEHTEVDHHHHDSEHAEDHSHELVPLSEAVQVSKASFPSPLIHFQVLPVSTLFPVSSIAAFPPEPNLRIGLLPLDRTSILIL